MFGLLRHHRHDELVGVVVPGLLGAVGQHVLHQASIGVGVFPHPFLLQAGGHKQLHGAGDVDAVDDEIRRDHVARDEAAGAVHEEAARVAGGQRRVVVGEIGVGLLARREEGFLRQHTAFFGHALHGLGPQEAGQHVAALGCQLLAAHLHQLLHALRAGGLQRVTLGVDDVAQVHAFGIGQREGGDSAHTNSRLKIFRQRGLPGSGRRLFRPP